ncbi:hypothetical protein M9H77_18274 [Catharanthus roseus]|uniref:Uncharacterized protein n=1 Tax=Catharanthus roseus TaxID=4058 RepID=A0ACC0B704_CATRO|nr:hypothetical protein M9H77_18274 [Catharanthus roseus]
MMILAEPIYSISFQEPSFTKVDKLNGGKTCRNASIMKVIWQQPRYVKFELDMRLTSGKEAAASLRLPVQLTRKTSVDNYRNKVQVYFFTIVSYGGLKHAIDGTSLYIVGPDDELVAIMKVAMEDIRTAAVSKYFHVSCEQ